MKRRMKKLLALLMVTAMTASMTVTSFAAEFDGGDSGFGGGGQEGDMSGATSSDMPDEENVKDYYADEEDTITLSGYAYYTEDFAKSAIAATGCTALVFGGTEDVYSVSEIAALSETTAEYLAKYASDETGFNSYIVLGADESSDDFATAGNGITVDSGTLKITNAYIQTSGAIGRSPSGRYGVATLSTATTIINDSYVIHTGATEATSSIDAPPSNAGLLISGHGRSNFSVGNTVTEYFNSTVVAEGWAAMSTDSATGDGLYFYSYNSEAIAENGGYGVYADTSCHDYLYATDITSAEIGVIISNNGEVYVGAGSDASEELLADNTGATSDAGSVITAGRNDYQLHSPDMMGEGTAGYQAVMTVENSTLITTTELESSEDYYEAYSDAVGAYIDYVSGANILVKSTGAVITLNNVEAESYTDTLLLTTMNSDSMSRYLKSEGNDVEVTITDSKISGDIQHDDYQRDLYVSIEDSDYTGAVNYTEYAEWNETWADYAEDENCYWILDADTYITATHDTEITLTNSTWNVDADSEVTALTLDAASSVVIPEGVTLTVDGVAYTNTTLTSEDLTPAVSTLTITSVTCDHIYTTTSLASTVTAVTYTYNGETYTQTAENGVLTLVVDGVQVDLAEGASYTVESSYSITDTTVYDKGGPSAAPWSGKGSESDGMSVYYFRQALLVEDGAVVEDGSVTDAITGGTYNNSVASGITVQSAGAHFNGIYITGTSTYSLENITVYAEGDGGDDFSGWGAAVMADSSANITVDGSYIETAGTIRTAIWVGGNAVAKVTDTVVYAQETTDDYDTYDALVPAMMKRVPFALGMEGTVRATNVLGAGQAIYQNSIIVSTGWGALSTDSGQSYANTGTYALNVSDTLAGIGTLEVAEDGKDYTATKTIDGVTYGFTLGGSGYVTYADAGVMNYYENVQFYSPDYVQILASGLSSSTYENSYLYSERIAFMTQQAGGGTLTINNSTVDTEDALMQIKSGAANTGYSNLVVDNTTVNFNGDSTRTESGILVELVESDDAGNPGVTTYTINDTGDEATATSSTITDSTATFKNGDYEGDIWNSIYNYYQALDVTLENADLTGTVSSSVAVHVDLNGDVVENGTVLNAYTGSEEYDHANYLAEDGGTTGDYLIVGRFSHTVSEVLNNPINLTIDEKSSWTVTGDGYLNSLTVASLDDIAADAEGYTVYTGTLTVDGTEYEEGTYTATAGTADPTDDVTIVVAEISTEAEDTGVVASGQTYANVPYTFYAVDEDGNYVSAAVTVNTQNWTDGNVYFDMSVADGYELVSVDTVNGTVSENTSDSVDAEVASYGYVLVPSGMDEMTVTITVKSAASSSDNGYTLTVEPSSVEIGVGETETLIAELTGSAQQETQDDSAAPDDSQQPEEGGQPDDGAAPETDDGQTDDSATPEDGGETSGGSATYTAEEYAAFEAYKEEALANSTIMSFEPDYDQILSMSLDDYSSYEEACAAVDEAIASKADRFDGSGGGDSEGGEIPDGSGGDSESGDIPDGSGEIETPDGGSSDSDADVITYTFVSADESIATVSADGVVTGIAAGTTKVTVTAYVNGTEVASVDVPIVVTDDSSEPTEPTTPTEPTEPTEPTTPTEPSGSEDTDIDTSALEDAIAAAEALTESDYTADSWSALEEALASAKDALAALDSQDAIDAAAEALNAAIDALEAAADDDTDDGSSTSGSGDSSTSSGSSTTSTSSSAKTGDTNMAVLWLVILLVGGCGAAIVIRRRYVH